MPKAQGKEVANAIEIFRKEKVMNLKQLTELLRCCERTIQRQLKQWSAYTSYNQNGRYYALPDIPRFDLNGLWRYNGIFFSRYGNLKKTVIHLVSNSKAGLTAREIGEIMRLSPNSFLTYFRNIQQLHHEKVDNRYIYFSPDEEVLAIQKQKRQEDDDRVKLTKLPNDAEVVVILVERIKYPHLDIEQLSARLSKKKCRITPELIRNLFEHYGLLKKTLDMQR